MRPLGPDPVTSARLIFRSAASFTARGLALMPESPDERAATEEVPGAGFSGVFCSAAGCSAGFSGADCFSGFSSAEASASASASSLPPPEPSSAISFSRAEVSSPFSPRIAIVCPTRAFPPSPTMIFRSVPSCVASYSMEALSVSTSQRTSPAEMTSPSFALHPVIVPSSIVGDRAVIGTFSAIVYSL